MLAKLIHELMSLYPGAHRALLQAIKLLFGSKI
jgi:hypothetical protein